MENALKLAYSLLILPIVEAIDRLTAAVLASKGTQPSCTASAPAVVEDTPEPESAKENPKAAKAKAAKANPKPEPKVEEPEIEVPTGPELAELMQPLKGTPYAAELVNYKKGELKCPDLLKDITDKGILAKMAEKINELLKKQADEDC